jgi:hypothetical protein
MPSLRQIIDINGTDLFYTIHVCEYWSDRTDWGKTIIWDIFHVNEELSIVLWENLITGELLTLDMWKDSSYYRDLE